MNSNDGPDSQPLRRPAIFNLQSKMLIGFGALLAATVILVVMVSTFGIPFSGLEGLYGHQRSEALAKLSLVADLRKDRFELWLDERNKHATALAQNIVVPTSVKDLQKVFGKNVTQGKAGDGLWTALHNEEGYRKLSRRFQQLTYTYTFYEKVQVVEAPTGKVLYSTDAEDLCLDMSKQRFYEDALSESGESVTIERIPATDKQYLIVSHIISDPDEPRVARDTAIGVLVLYIDMDESLRPLLYSGGSLGNSGDVMLLNEDGGILMPLKRPLADDTKAKILEHQMKRPFTRPDGEGKEAMVITPDYRGVSVLAAYRKIKVTPDRDWIMVVTCDESEVFGPVRRAVFYASAVGLFGILAAAVMATLLANKISRPIHSLSLAARAVESGNLDVRAPVVGLDEVGSLASTFNSMIRRIQYWHDELAEQVKERTARLNQVNLTLSEEIANRRRAEMGLIRSNRALKTLSDCNQALVRTRDEHELMQAICRVIVEVGGYSLAWVGLVEDSSERTVRPVAQYGTDNGHLEGLKISWADNKTGRGPTGTAIRTHEPSVAHDVRLPTGNEPMTPESAGRSYASMIALPLIDGDRCFGVLSICAGDPKAFDAEEKKLLVELAADLSYGIMALRTRRERLLAEEAVRSSEERMRLVIESSPIGIEIVQDGKAKYVNPAFVKMFDYGGSNEIEGMRVEDLFVKADGLPLSRRPKAGSTPQGSPPVFEGKGLKKSGKTFHVQVWQTSTRFGGEEAQLAFVLDVSQEKSLRSQLLQAQKMEAIGALAGGVAHDFNNLLQVMFGFSELLLLDKIEGDHGYDELQEIANAARSGTDLVRSLLAFSRKLDTQPRPINLNNHVKQANKFMSRIIPRMIEIELHPEENLAPISADPTQMEQVLMNLAVNARDSMPEGGKLIIGTDNVTLDEEYCRMHVETNPGNYVLLTVSDTGHGMDEETVERVFEPFFTTKKPGEGTGLGLAMVYGIVKQHGGHITCYSVPDQGTTFRIFLPAMGSRIERGERQDPVMLSGGEETVLLVDDEESIRKLGVMILERGGYRVLTATNGKEALEIYGTNRDSISLVILDIIMPVMGGRQCLDELLKIDPAAKVIIASGYSAYVRTTEGTVSGAKGFMSKPYDVNRMLRTVRDVLDRND